MGSLSLIATLGVFVSCALVKEHPSGEEVKLLREGASCRMQPSSGVNVRWIESPMEDERWILARWCATVGPPVAMPPARSGETPALDSLTVLDWNAYVGGGDVVVAIEALQRGDFTNGRPVAHFVVLLQETFRAGEAVPTDANPKYSPDRTEEYPPSGERIDVVEVARKFGLGLFYVPSMRNGDPGSGATEEDRGNAILSTLPMTDFTAVELPYEIHRRVAVAATVSGTTTSGEPWTLRVCSAHLDHRSGFPWVRSWGIGRLRQARALTTALVAPRIVMGADINTWAIARLEPAVRVLDKAFPQTMALSTKPTATRKWVPDRRVDHIYFRLPDPCRGTYRRLDDRMGSDHWPLLGSVPLACASE